MLPLALRHALAALERGAVVAYPTEGVWGLGCDPLHPVAVSRLLWLKQRPVDKGLILIGGRLEDVLPYIEVPSRRALRRALDTWPGPTTWRFPASAMAPDWITGGRDSICVRVTAHAVAARLCHAWGGALVSTSANRSGTPPLAGATQVRLRLGRHLGALLPGRLGGLGRPSTIRDIHTGAMLRQ